MTNHRKHTVSIFESRINVYNNNWQRLRQNRFSNVNTIRNSHFGFLSKRNYCAVKPKKLLQCVACYIRLITTIKTLFTSAFLQKRYLLRFL